MKPTMDIARHALWLAAALLLLGREPACLAEAGPGQWIAVTSPAFRPALAPLIQRRQQEGFRVVVIETSALLTMEQILRGNGEPVRARLKELCQQFDGPSCVLLAGIRAGANSMTAASAIVPPLRGGVARMAGQPTDSGFGLPAADGTPTVAVGRFPARDTDDLRAMVQKTLRFEEDSRPAPWRNRLLLFVGDPGGGKLADFYVEQTFDSDLARLDPSLDVRTLFNVPSSRFYLPPPKDRDVALNYLQEGALFSIYLGHSDASGMGFYSPFLTRDNWQKLDIPQGAGPFFTCGCFALESSPRGEGYGLAAIRNASGPVAVIGAAGSSDSAAGQLAAEGLLTRLAKPPFPDRLGDYWLAVAAGLAHGNMDAATYALLDMADGSGGQESLATMRLEHLEMWALLGDPALRMPVVPLDITLDPIGPASAGKPLTVSGLLPKRLGGAAVRLALERPKNSPSYNLESVPSATPQNRAALAGLVATNHQRANDFVLVSTNAETLDHVFKVTLRVPDRVPWRTLVLRASSTLSNETALGICIIPVNSASPPSPPRPEHHNARPKTSWKANPSSLFDSNCSRRRLSSALISASVRESVSRLSINSLARAVRSSGDNDKASSATVKFVSGMEKLYRR